MNTTSTISIIIPVYNRQAFLVQAIESVLCQTYSNFELLIWDDGSTDQSLEIAETYAKTDPRLRVISSHNQGIAQTLHQAIAQTTGQYLGWVDSDDRLALTALEKTVAVLNAMPDVGMVYTNYDIIDAKGNNLGQGRRCQVPYSPTQLIVQFMTFHFRLIRRSVYDQVGGINPAYERAEDYDLCLRLSEITQIQHMPESLYFYRHHASNMTHQQLEQIRWAYRASTEALQRRGWQHHYSLDLELKSRFILRPIAVPSISNSVPPNVDAANLATDSTTVRTEGVSD